MFFRNIKLALYNIRHDKLNFAIAILGLAVGLVAAALLTSYCLYYFNYDRNVSNPNEWYRLRLTTTTPEDGDSNWSGFYMATVGCMVKEIPEIKDYAIFWNIGLNVNFTCEGKPLPMNNFCWTTSNIIEHYKLKIIYGNPDTLFTYKNNIIISRSYAERNFGKQNPVGKIVCLKDHPRFVISGVFEDLPENLHFRNDIYAQIQLQKDKADSPNDYLMKGHVRIRIPDPNAVPGVEKALNELFIKNPFFGEEGVKQTVKLDPISRIHFMPNLKDDQPTMSLTNVYAVLTIGILILLAALLNFINLVLLSWQKRTDEFTFRRYLGAGRGDILQLLITEYSVYFLLAVMVALGLYFLTSDIFAGLLGLNLTPYTPDKGMQPAIALLLLLATAIVTGALASASFSGRTVFNEEYRFRSKETGNFAILFVQTVIGFLFIAMALITARQMLFIRQLDLGFNTKNTLQYKYVTVLNHSNTHYYDANTLRDRIRSLPGVIKETASTFNTVSEGLNLRDGFLELPMTLIDGSRSRHITSYSTAMLPDFIKIRGIKLLQGRLPDGKTRTEVVVNRTFAEKYFPGSSPLGKYLNSPSDESDEEPPSAIVGVVEDSWFFPLHNPMPPMFYWFAPATLEYFQVTYAPGRKSEMVASLDSLFRSVTNDPGTLNPFGFTHVDIPEEQKLFYKDDTTYMRLSVFFALIIALISGMGIYAVSSLHIRHQMKDIAIRKICGAEFKDLFRLNMKNYLILLATAGFTGLVAAYYLTELFLDRFALKAAYPWYMYPLTVVILGLLVLVPLYFNLLKAWHTDPNRYLQSE